MTEIFFSKIPVKFKSLREALKTSAEKNHYKLLAVRHGIYPFSL